MRYPSPLSSSARRSAVPVNTSTSSVRFVIIHASPRAGRIARDVPEPLWPHPRLTLDIISSMSRSSVLIIALLTALGGYWAGAHRSAAGEAASPAAQAAA